MNLNWVGEAQKLFAITAYLSKQYARIFFGLNDETRAFFTRLYRELEKPKIPPPEIPKAAPSPLPRRSLQTIKASSLATVGNGLLEVHLCNAPKSVLDSEFGLEAAMLSSREQLVMNALVRLRDPKAIFEFGTCRGATTYNLYRNSSPDARLHTIDLWSHDRPEVVEQAFRDSRVAWLIGDSRSFDFYAYSDFMDFIFVDGGHDYVTVKSDTENALRMGKKGALILWHDYCEDHPGVMECLNELMERYPVRLIEGTTLVALLL